jgi:hypothetical protein
MAKLRPYRAHLKSSGDLVTSYEAVRAGFVALALEKNRRATPFVKQARALKVAASSIVNPSDLIKLEGIRWPAFPIAGCTPLTTHGRR